ncbi:MAG: DUF4403 family protein, partial [Bacteroidota bacterium]
EAVGRAEGWASKAKFMVGCLLTLSLLLLLGCGDKTKADKVQEAYGELPELPLSTLSIPLRIEMEELTQLINEQLANANFTNTTGEAEDQRLQVEIKKADDIALEVFSDQIRYIVPLDLDVSYDLSFGKAEADGVLALDFRSRFAIDSSWQLTTDTELTSHQWEKEPKLKLGVVSLPIASISNYVIRQFKTNLEQEIDRAVAEQIGLAGYVTEAWNLLQQPILAAENYQAWLQINPQDLRMTPLQTSEKEIAATISLDAQPRITFGEEPPAQLPATFPMFRYDNRPPADNDFQLRIGTLVAYEEAERLASESVLGETFSSGNRSVTVDDLKIFGSNGRLIVELTASGAYNGNIYLSGVPSYNNRQNRLDIKQLDFTLDTKNFLTKTAAWLFKSRLKRTIQDNLNEVVTENLDSMRQQIESQLTRQEITKDIVLSGELNELGLGDTFLTPDGIEIVVTLSGDLALDVSGLTQLTQE